ncbi:hypothetical protein [Gracilibacillus saliphilus]|uniref:hypothetical protein n=1 Tax=Gracilibacillus saliphilus TaxID=543890 RepID=UPI0013D1082D|nr:hypothetical protein [Gracilibacillus saliphilus]
MKKWLLLIVVTGVLIGCGQQEDEVTPNESVNDESEENVLEEASTDSNVKAEASEENEEAVTKESDQQLTTTSQESEDDSQKSKDATKEQSVDEQEIDIEFIKNELKIGMIEQEVKELIGEPFKKGYDAKNAEPTWLYNIRPIKGYYFEQPFENEDIVDAIDEEGLKNGEVEIILFITWEEDKVSYVNASYTNDKGQIKKYRLFEDRTVKES